VSRRSWIIAAVVVALVVAGVPVGYLALKQRQEAADRSAQRASATAFARAWKGGTLATLSYANAEGADVAKAVQTITSGLTPAAKDAPSGVTVESVTGKPEAASVRLRVRWRLAGDRTWAYQTTLPLEHEGDRWLPRYEPTVVHPKLVDQAVLKSSTDQPTRGEIIGADDKVLVSERPVVAVGLQPSRADDIEASAEQIAEITGVDGAALAKRAKAASGDSFVEAIALREKAYKKVRDELQPIPGAVFQERSVALAPSSEFARALIGTVGQATAEIIKESKNRVRTGDATGLSGLQRAYDEQLGGTPGVAVRMVTKADTPPQVLFSAGAVAGKPVHVTLDEKIQKAADAALEAAPNPAALVAIRAGTGDVLAVANGGPNASGYNRALLGRYPPGSTFKVITTLGLLGTGLDPDEGVKCPPTLNVNGKTFRNFEGEVLGTVPFHTDFALSCNTAFIGQASKISAEDLAKAASSLGFGAKNQLGVNAFTGEIPDSGDAVAHAAAMIGQGKVLASPVTVAGAAAAVGSGTWHAPRLVVDPTEPPDAGIPLSKKKDTALKKLMREVVTSGTGTGLRSTPGGDVAGKTGTAEYGNDDPPKTHAWFTGFQGDIAFAVVVEDGGTGAETAVPLVKRFLTRLAR
jgi:cell division protein FtsI/penicillin-binding protein 2